MSGGTTMMGARGEDQDRCPMAKRERHEPLSTLKFF